MCEMVSSKDCFTQMIETCGRCSLGWMFLTSCFLFLCSSASLCLEDSLRYITTCMRGGMILLWPRMSTITIMSFLSYRDAVQLHDSPLNLRFVILTCMCSTNVLIIYQSPNDLDTAHTWYIIYEQFHIQSRPFEGICRIHNSFAYR
jgi:hypothetical protein